MDPAITAGIFRSDLFTASSMTAFIDEIPYVPQRLAELNLFAVDGIATTTAWIERRGTTLVLVGNTPRGGVGQNVTIDRRQAVPFQAAHLQLDDTIYADEIQNVRAFGSPDQMLGGQQVRDQRLTKMSQSIDLTLEYHRLGAIQGVVLDADGTTVLEDLYDKFGLSEPAAVSLELDAAWAVGDGGAVLKRITPVLRAIDAELGGFQPSGYYAACGDDFFDELVGHPELGPQYQFQQNARDQAGDSRRQFIYGGVVWENYRGSGAVAIADAEARLIPTGVPELFKQLFAPADTMAAVNTMGQVKYAMSAPDPSGHDKFITVSAQSNPITFCTRPLVLRKLTLT